MDKKFVDELEAKLVQQFLPEVDKLSKLVQLTKIKKISPHQNGSLFIKFSDFKAVRFSKYNIKNQDGLVNHFFKDLKTFIAGYMTNYQIIDADFSQMTSWEQNRFRSYQAINSIEILKKKLTDKAKENIKNLYKQIQSGFNTAEMSKKLEEGKISKKKYSMKFAKKRLAYEVKVAIKLDLNEEDLMQIFKECLADELLNS